ncbi:hypothetical protein ACS0TY_011652 [Phlomoides rotata]
MKTIDVKTWKDSVKYASLILIALVAMGTLGLMPMKRVVVFKEEQIADEKGPIATCFQVNGFMTMYRTRFIKRNNVLIWVTNFVLVKNLEERTSNIRIGGGSLIIAIFPGCKLNYV